MVIKRNVANRSGRLAVAVAVGLAVIGCGAANTTSSSQPVPVATPIATLAVTASIAPSPVSNSSAALIDPPDDLPAASTYEQFAPFFDYHVDVAFDIKEKSTRQDAGATIRDITYTSEAGQPVDAYLVVPAGSGPFPAVLFEHGMGDNRDQLVDEAITLAQQQHVVGLVPTRPITPAATGTSEAILQIREMRHGYDLLASQPGVDKSRLGYVGFSMGAVLGSEIVAFERRIKTAVLIEGVPSVAQNWLDTAALAPHATTGILATACASNEGREGVDLRARRRGPHLRNAQAQISTGP